MQAAILAGGLGTRLKPITKTIPKCMAEVNGRPFLYYLLKLLSTRGVGRIIMLTGYLGEQVEKYFKDGSKLGLEIRYSRETEGLRGTGGALKLAESFLEENFIVINGDTYLDIDYQGVYQTFLDSGLEALVVTRASGEGERSDLEIDRKMLVTRYDKESGRNLKYVNAGVIAMKREVIANITQGTPVSLEKDILPPLIRRHQLMAWISDTRFYDIGTLPALNIFAEEAKEKQL